MSVPSYDEQINADSGNYSLRQYQEDIGSANPTLKARVIEKGVDVICTIHKNFPIAWLADNLVNDGKIAPEHLLLDDLCRPRNQVPPDPTREAEGGQCADVLYRVEADYYFEGQFQRRFAAQRIGKITELGISSDGSNIGFTYGTPTYPPARYKFVDGNVSEIRAGRFALRNWSITRPDGLPDSCGSAPLRYPPALPSPSDLTKTSPIQITPTLNAPITVTVKPTIQFSPTIGSPVILFNSGGVNVKFDLGGFTFSPSFGNTTNNNFPNTTSPDPDPVVVKPPSKHVADDIDILEIINRLDRIGREVERCCERDAPYPPPDATKVLTTVMGTANSGLYDLPKNTFQVGIKVVESLEDVKTQAGNNAPTVYFLGWAWFGTANNMSDRMPIDSAFKVYSPPRYITGSFAFTLYGTKTAIITAYSIKPKPQEGEPT